MPAFVPNQLIAGGTAAQWTKLGTDLTQFRDLAQYLGPNAGTPATIGPLAVPPTVGQVPRLGGWDQDLRGLLAAADQDPLPPEIHALVVLFSQGLATSFFNGTAIPTSPTSSNSSYLDFGFAVSLLRHYLGIFMRRGMPRGVRTDLSAPGPGA